MPRRVEDRHFIAAFLAIAALGVAPSAYARVANPSVPYDAEAGALAMERAAVERAAEEAAIVHIAVIGDSYTGGSEMGGTATGTNWTTWVARSLIDGGRRVELTRDGVGGTGYLAGDAESQTFLDRVGVAVNPETEIVIVFGSRNDVGRGDAQPAASATYVAIREISPDARILVIGPPSSVYPVPAPLSATNDEIAAAAAGAGVRFVDPVAEEWFAAADARFIGSDGVHPTDEGHQYMADKLAEVIAEEVDAVPVG